MADESGEKDNKESREPEGNGLNVGDDTNKVKDEGFNIEESPLKTPPFASTKPTPIASNDDIIKALLAQNQMLAQALLQQRTVPQPTVSKQKPRTPSPVKQTPPTVFSNEISQLTAAVTALTQKVTELENNRAYQPTATSEIQSQLDSNKRQLEDRAMSDTDLREKMASILGVSNTRLIDTTDEDGEKQTGKKMKSGHELRAENDIVHSVPWPHLRVHDAHVIKGADYDKLSIPQFIFAYMKQMNEPDNENIRCHMHKHLETLMDDFKEMPNDWERIRAFHSLILKHIERGWLTWDNYTEINILRQKYIFPHIQQKITVYPCQDFNKGNCSWRRDHDSLKHICAHCYENFDRECHHAKQACYKLNGPPRFPRNNQPKNEDKN
ncbi:MAG: hypothetical protein GY702_19020 [Desulfobulbaceae bacterium]|nr:hypothetical protein [Desulfobulbaceae bacterium]